MSIRIFKIGLPTEHELRKSLTKKLTQSMCQLIDQIDKHKRVEDDQQRGRGRGRQKWLLLTKETLGLRGIITMDPGEIFLDILGFLLPR